MQVASGLEFRAGEVMSASKLNELVAIAEGNKGSNVGAGGNRNRRPSTRSRGLLATTLTAPSSAIDAPTKAKAYELQWIEARQRLVVVDAVLILLHNFDPDMHAGIGYYVKWEDIGDGINEVYYASCSLGGAESSSGSA